MGFDRSLRPRLDALAQAEFRPPYYAGHSSLRRQPGSGVCRAGRAARAGAQSGASLQNTWWIAGRDPAWHWSYGFVDRGVDQEPRRTPGKHQHPDARTGDGRGWSRLLSHSRRLAKAGRSGRVRGLTSCGPGSAITSPNTSDKNFEFPSLLALCVHWSIRAKLEIYMAKRPTYLLAYLLFVGIAAGIASPQSSSGDAPRVAHLYQTGPDPNISPPTS